MTRLALEALLRCPACQGVPFRVFRRPVAPDSEFFEHVLWPAAPGVAPPENPRALCCPSCVTHPPLHRVAP